MLEIIAKNEHSIHEALEKARSDKKHLEKLDAYERALAKPKIEGCRETNITDHNAIWYRLPLPDVNQSEVVTSP